MTYNFTNMSFVQKESNSIWSATKTTKSRRAVAIFIFLIHLLFVIISLIT